MENILEYKIIENKKIAKDVFKMILEGDTSQITNPGQFINIELEGFYLRRPISICDYDDRTITVIYKVVGNGTDFMSNLKPSKVLNILTGLGNGFDINCDGDNPLLIGGGVGTPPMYNLCKKLLNAGKKPIVVLGFNTEEDVFYEKEFKDLDKYFISYKNRFIMKLKNRYNKEMQKYKDIDTKRYYGILKKKKNSNKKWSEPKMLDKKV